MDIHILRFTIQEVLDVEYNEIESIDPVRSFKKDNVGLIVVTQGNSGVICVATTHFHWNPKLADLKTLQAAYLLSKVQQVVEKYGNISVFITGDFNSLPGSAVYPVNYSFVTLTDTNYFKMDF